MSERNLPFPIRTDTCPPHHHNNRPPWPESICTWPLQLGRLLSLSATPANRPESDEKWIKEKHIVVRKVIEARRRTTSFAQRKCSFCVYIFMPFIIWPAQGREAKTTTGTFCRRKDNCRCSRPSFLEDRFDVDPPRNSQSASVFRSTEFITFLYILLFSSCSARVVLRRC